MTVLTAMAIVTWQLPQANALSPTKSSQAKQSPTKASPNKTGKSIDLSGLYQNYYNSLRAKVLSNWSYPDGNNIVNLDCQVAKDGTVTSLIIKSSTNSSQGTMAEQAAGEAFQKVQPLAALPGNLPASKLHFVFNSNVDPHGDCKVSLDGFIEPSSNSNPPTEEKATGPDMQADSKTDSQVSGD
jgi:hypothetical protein